MPIPAADLERRVRKAFPDAEIRLIDLAGDDNHYELTIVSESFRGKSRIIQHRMVNEALADILGGVLHALALKTATPA